MHQTSSATPRRQVPVAWEALEDAFENNAPEVHSYLHLDTGEVIRIVDGVADPAMHGRIMSDAQYLRVDPVSSREQYRWMERFIATVEDPELRHKLFRAIDGKGAFRRFKDVLMSYPVDRERWFVFRSERVQSCMESWLTAHGIEVVARPQWHVPSADEVRPGEGAALVETPAASETSPAALPARPAAAPVAAVPGKTVSDSRLRLRRLVDSLSESQVVHCVAYVEFLIEREGSASVPAAQGEASAAQENASESESARNGRAQNALDSGSFHGDPTV